VLKPSVATATATMSVASTVSVSTTDSSVSVSSVFAESLPHAVNAMLATSASATYLTFLIGGSPCIWE